MLTQQELRQERISHRENGGLQHERLATTEISAETINVEEDMEGMRCERGFVSDNVVNLSERDLTEEQINLLSRGLKFCPHQRR